MGGKSVAFSHIFLDIMKIFCVCFVLGVIRLKKLWRISRYGNILLLTFFTAFTQPQNMVLTTLFFKHCLYNFESLLYHCSFLAREYWMRERWFLGYIFWMNFDCENGFSFLELWFDPGLWRERPLQGLDLGWFG